MNWRTWVSQCGVGIVFFPPPRIQNNAHFYHFFCMFSAFRVWKTNRCWEGVVKKKFWATKRRYFVHNTLCLWSSVQIFLEAQTSLRTFFSSFLPPLIKAEYRVLFPELFFFLGVTSRALSPRRRFPPPPPIFFFWTRAFSQLCPPSFLSP